MTAIVYSPKFLHHKNLGHPERPERLVAIMEFLEEMPFFSSLHMVHPSPLEEEYIKEIHSQEMIERVKNTVGWLDPDTYVGKESYEIAKLAAGGLVNVCMDIMDGKEKNAFALIRPPGHHATATRSMGFCLFNNVALAAHALAKKGKRVLIFDHDVHHGNGTCDIFYERSDVMYQSIHLFPHYPGTGMMEEVGKGDGEGFTVNAPLPRFVGDCGIEKILDEIFLPISEQFSPDIIIISAGFDSHHADPLGGLSLSINFYGKMIEKFREIQKRIVCALEGGYKLDTLKKGVISEIGMLNNTPITFDDYSDEKTDVEEIVKNLRKTFQDYWEL
ncbi:MAG: histone deacetylase [Thermoplasmata archaeon]|nr:MAG: histone deacetylase [Thermoplasmata archaeon]